MIHGELPNKTELAAYHAKLKKLRDIPAALKTVLEQIPKNTHPMDVMRTGCAMLGTLEPEAADRNTQVHPLLCEKGGWYEEDSAWAAIAIAWPDLFTGLERRQAEETLRHSWPDAWEAIYGRALRPGESRARDGEAFARDHAKDWVVISAIYSDQHRGFTEVIATRGGRRDPQSEESRFLVPSGEYKVGAFGFVIDEARHAVYDGPSSFIGWRGRAGG